MKIRTLFPVVILGLFLGCSDDKPNEPIAVAVEPATATVALGQTQQFTATVTGTGNLAVTWYLDGEATHGTITASGLYSAPAGMPNPATITVRATSQEDGSKSGTATVALAPVIVVNVSPSAQSIYVNETQQFTAVVVGAGNQAVTWTLDNFGGKGSITSAGFYTAPATVPIPATVTVRATSQADPAESGVAQATILPAETVPEGFVHIPAGSFTMGDGSESSSCGIQQHDVTLTHDFYLGQSEVTNQQFLDMVQWAYDQGYVAVTDSVVYDRLDGRTGTEIALLHMEDSVSEIAFSGAEFSLRDAGRGINPDHPVKTVTWYGAVAYSDWLSLHAGEARAYSHATWICNGGAPYGAAGYRLPTDAEWEYAAQFDDERIYPWGNESPTCGRANWWGQLGGCVSWTTPVMSYPAEKFIAGNALYDMAGNVWEWCNDWFACGLGTGSIADPAGPSSGTHRVLRGGSWYSSPDGTVLRCASRNDFIPVTRNDNIGLRVVRTMTP
jgi:formylglycine-generating enzyme required for sulfatase activity